MLKKQYRCFEISDKSIQVMVSCLENTLQLFSASYCEKITPRAINQLVAKQTHLRKLDLSNLFLIGDPDVILIAETLGYSSFLSDIFPKN